MNPQLESDRKQSLQAYMAGWRKAAASGYVSDAQRTIVEFMTGHADGSAALNEAYARAAKKFKVKPAATMAAILR